MEVPGVDIEIAKDAVKHLSYDPRVSGTNMPSFNTAQDSLIQLGSSSADKRLDMSAVVMRKVMQKTEKSHPRYFADLQKVSY